MTTMSVLECSCARFSLVQEYCEALLAGNAGRGLAEAQEYARAICAAELREDFEEMHRIIQQALYGRRKEATDAA
jgi:hypothetical protein